MRHPIIIDTDPGQDDAVAILLALASPEIEVLGITAVAGNVPLALTEMNARKICELAGKPDTRVYSGAARPMLRKLVTAEHVHGRTGLNGPELPDPTMKLEKQHAVGRELSLPVGGDLPHPEVPVANECALLAIGRSRLGWRADAGRDDHRRRRVQERLASCRSCGAVGAFAGWCLNQDRR